MRSYSNDGFTFFCGIFKAHWMSLNPNKNSGYSNRRTVMCLFEGLGTTSPPPLLDLIDVEKTHREVIRAHKKFGLKWTNRFKTIVKNSKLRFDCGFTTRWFNQVVWFLVVITPTWSYQHTPIRILWKSYVSQKLWPKYDFDTFQKTHLVE